VLARLATWARYVPALGDNRARHAAGEPALIVEIRPPTARTWRRFMLAITPDEGPAELKPGTIYRALLNDATAEILWRDCVGAVVCPPGLLGGLDESTLPKDGAALWELRDRLADLDAYRLYDDVLNACIGQATLEAGLADFLASGPGPPPSTDGALHGTARPVASGA
jgi:hypothetical protein